MIEIKFGNKKIKSEKIKVPTSKKLALFSCICFAVAIIFCMVIFAYGIINDKIFESSMLVTLITVSGAVVGVTMVAYSNKARYENVNKLQQAGLKSKYLILRDIGSLDDERVKSEIEDALSKIESDIDNEKTMSNPEVTYNG